MLFLVYTFRLRHMVKDKLLDKEEVTQRSWASILGDIQAEAETAVAFICIKRKEKN